MLTASSVATSCHSQDDHLVAGARSYDQGHHHAAIAAFREHLSRHPQCFEAMFNLAAACEAADDVEAASRYFSQASQMNPGHLDAWKRGLQAMAKTGDAVAFADQLVRFIDACRTHGLFWKWPYYMLQNACEYHMNRGDPATTFAMFNAVIGRSNAYDRLNMGWFVFLFGGYFLRIGDVENATNCIRFAEKHVHFLVHACFGDEFRVRCASVPAAFEQAFDDSVRFLDPVPGDAADHGCVVLCACDATYFKRFGHLMALSVDIFSVRPRIIHFHVIDTDAGCLAVLDRIRQNLRGTRVFFSSQPDYQKLPGDDRLTYFTCSRFMIAGTILERYKLPVLVADVDGVFIDDPILFTAQLSDAVPLALLYGPERLDALYNGVGAGLVGLFPTRPVLELVRRVKRCMLHWYERRKLVWFFDQLTWVCAVDDAKRRGELPPMHRLRMDQGRITLGAAKFFQVFDEKREDGFDDKVGVFLDEIGRLWRSSDIDPATARTRYQDFFRIKDL